MTIPPFIRLAVDGAVLSIKLQPRSSSDEIGQPLGDELRIKVTAPPVDSAANDAMLKLLAKRFHCGRSQIILMRGHTSRHKLVKIQGISAEEVMRHLGIP